MIFMKNQSHSNADIIGSFIKLAPAYKGASSYCTLTLKVSSTPHYKTDDSDTLIAHAYVKILIPSRFYNHLKHLNTEATIALFNCIPFQTEQVTENKCKILETKFTATNIAVHIPKEEIVFIKF